MKNPTAFRTRKVVQISLASEYDFRLSDAFTVFEFLAKLQFFRIYLKENNFTASLGRPNAEMFILKNTVHLENIKHFMS